MSLLMLEDGVSINVNNIVKICFYGSCDDNKEPIGDEFEFKMSDGSIVSCPKYNNDKTLNEFFDSVLDWYNKAMINEPKDKDVVKDTAAKDTTVKDTTVKDTDIKNSN